MVEDIIGHLKDNIIYDERDWCCSIYGSSPLLGDPKPVLAYYFKDASQHFTLCVDRHYLIICHTEHVDTRCKYEKHLVRMTQDLVDISHPDAFDILGDILPEGLQYIGNENGPIS